MYSRQVRSFVAKFALLIAVITLAPLLRAQDARVILPGSAAFDALPAAIAPAVMSAASATSISYTPHVMSAIYVPDASPLKPEHKIAVETYPSRRNWLFLAIASHGAASFDAYTTRRAIATGDVEEDPTMRPFVHSGAIYGAIQASPLVMDYAAYKMQRSGNRFIRKLWWIPQTGGTAMSLFAGAHNLSVAGR